MPLVRKRVKTKCIFITALIGKQNEKSMRAFQFGTINGIRHIIGLEKRPDGSEMAELVHDKYLTASKPYTDQIREIEEASINPKSSVFSKFNVIHFSSWHQTRSFSSHSLYPVN